MKKNCFKFLAIAMAALLLLPSFAACGTVEKIGDSISGIFEKSTPVEDFEFGEVNKGYCIIAYNGYDKDIILPKKYRGKKIVQILPNAFAGSDITSITIPDSVTSIGEKVFRNCRSLTSITIPDSVTSIGESAFEYCTGLTSVTIGNGVTSIGESAFRCCESLTSVTIGNGVTSIGERAFFDCTSLTSITIPESVTSIGDEAFVSCTGLTSVTIGNGVKSIGKSAFNDCKGLTSITIPDSVTSIGASAFFDCTSLDSLTFEDTEDWYYNFHYGEDGEHPFDVSDPSKNAEELTSAPYLVMYSFTFYKKQK